MICRKVLFLAGLTLCVIVHVSGQIVNSAQNGFWNDPSTWEGGTVPAMGSGSVVRVNHDISLSTTVEVGVLEISGSLTITSAGSLEMIPPQGGGVLRVHHGGGLHVSGALTGYDSVQFETHASNTVFESGGVFIFRGSSRAFIPFASWDAESILHINGFSTSGYVALDYSESWKQSFGHVIYDCPQQTSFVDFNGHLRDIRGDFIIRNTNNQSLRLSTTQRPVLRIGRDFRVEGPSEIWITTTSDSVQLIIGRDFYYGSTSSGPSYLATQGRCHVQVGGTFLVNASGPIRFCSGSTGSSGVRRSTIALSGDFQLMRGDLIAPSPGKGTLVFCGTAPQNVSIGTSVLTGTFDLHVEAASTVDLATSVVRIENGNVFIKGHVRLGSTDAEGALQNRDGGNLQVNGLKRFYPDATIEYNGLAKQFVGDGHPTDENVDVVFNNFNGVELLNDVIARNVGVLSGELDANNYSFQAYGDILLSESARLVNASTITMAGTHNAFLSLRGARIQDLLISKSEPADVVVTSPLDIMKSLVIMSGSSVLHANGYITLLSRADIPGGTASVAPIPDGSSITGDVTVQRYMSGEGRLYRYLASPVANANVTSMMDDFPVTGTFADPSTGQGIAITSPSLFYYENGWQPFPVSGLASDSYLEPGRGYAAFIRGGSNPVVWDVTGELNQGPYVLNVKRDVQEGDPFAGWNLVGNPYASAVKWGGAGWALQGISMSVAIRDNGENRFRYTDGEVGDVVNGTIASGQAFWVYATDDNPTLVIDESAKALADASFYRAGETDHVQLSIAGPEGADIAWLRIRPGSAKTLDRFDAVKLPNDELSLAILTTDSVAVAIAAYDQVECGKVIPVSITGPSGAAIKPGTYTIKIETAGMFSRSTVSVIDYFKADTTSIDVFRFVVSDDPASAQANRFGLLITKANPSVLPELSVPLHCQDTLVQVNVANITDVTRVAALHNGRYFYADVAGVINIPEPFGEGEETMKVVITSESVCRRVALDTLVIARHHSPTAPVVSGAMRCGAGTFLLIAQRNGNYNLVWFDDETHDEPVFVGESFTTPEIGKSKTYYVLAEDSVGCRSELKSVYCEVILPDSLEILRQGQTLTSNYSETKWFVDHELRHTGQNFEPAKSGNVTATAEVKGCVVKASYGYYDSGPVITPIPFSTQLLISFPEGEDAGSIEEVLVYDNLGREILRNLPDSDRLSMDTTPWPDGVFILSVRTDGGTYRIRVIKKS